MLHAALWCHPTGALLRVGWVGVLFVAGSQLWHVHQHSCSIALWYAAAHILCWYRAVPLCSRHRNRQSCFAHLQRQQGRSDCDQPAIVTCLLSTAACHWAVQDCSLSSLQQSGRQWPARASVNARLPYAASVQGCTLYPRDDVACTRPQVGGQLGVWQQCLHVCVRMSVLACSLFLCLYICHGHGVVVCSPIVLRVAQAYMRMLWVCVLWLRLAGDGLSVQACARQG